MQNFMKTILSAMKAWTRKEINKISNRIVESTADWNQNDSNADSYVKNRTHWEEEGRIYNLDKKIYTFPREFTQINHATGTTYELCGTILKESIKLNIPIEKGQEYIVYFDEKEYRLKCEETEGSLYLGWDYYSAPTNEHEFGICCNFDGSELREIFTYRSDTNQHTVAVYRIGTIIHKLDSKYLNLPTNLATTDDVQDALDTANEAYQVAENAISQLSAEEEARKEADATKMDKDNPVGSGSFSMGRKPDSQTGRDSKAMGEGVVAEYANSFVEGKYNVCSNEKYYILNTDNAATSQQSTAGTATYRCSTGYRFDNETGKFYPEGEILSGYAWTTIPKGYYFCKTDWKNFGSEVLYCLKDSSILVRTEGSYYKYEDVIKLESLSITEYEKYAHIVGNGTSDTARSNAHTLDWDGNAWYSGDVYVGSASGKNKDEGSKKLATEEFVSSKIAEAELGGEEVDLSGYALKSELPSRVSQLQNDSGYITGYTETDPTVPAWAKAASKPTYTASEVGADSKGTASSAVSAHNTATDAHNDIRLALKDINDRLNAFFDSDDKTLDELSEIVTYITNNKALIDSITTSKVSVSDIINNLTTNVSNKPLSAAQGVALKGLIDTLNSGKLDASALSAAINTALAQAKASGEFDGKDGATGATGATGVGIKSITIQEVS